jgi:hypothetical protein
VTTTSFATTTRMGLRQELMLSSIGMDGRRDRAAC